MPGRFDLTLQRLRRAPLHYRFFVVGEVVWFGDETFVRRYNSDPAFANSHELRGAWELVACEFASARMAEWVADRLNEATNR